MAVACLLVFLPPITILHALQRYCTVLWSCRLLLLRCTRILGGRWISTVLYKWMNSLDVESGEWTWLYPILLLYFWRSLSTYSVRWVAVSLSVSCDPVWSQTPNQGSFPVWFLLASMNFYRTSLIIDDLWQRLADVCKSFTHNLLLSTVSKACSFSFIRAILPI